MSATSAPVASAPASFQLPTCPEWLRAQAAAGMPPLFDTHVHLADSRAFPDDSIAALLASAREQGVCGFIAVSEDAVEATRCLDLARCHPGIVSAGAGMHPVRWSLLAGGRAAREAASVAIAAFIDAHHTQLTCVGEVGLDFSPWILQQATAITRAEASAGGDAAAPAAADWKQRQDSSADVFERAAQISLLCVQVRLALRHGLPLNVHSRNASKHVVALLREEGIGSVAAVATPVLLHAFDGSLSTLRDALKIGCFFSATTNLVRDEHIQRVIVQLLSEGPLEPLPANALDGAELNAACVFIPVTLLRIVLESDSPALHPVKQPPSSAATSSAGSSHASCTPENNTPATLHVALQTLHELYLRACEVRSAAEEAARTKRLAAANRLIKGKLESASPAAKDASSSSSSSQPSAANLPSPQPAATAAAALLTPSELAAVLLQNTRRLFPRTHPSASPQS